MAETVNSVRSLRGDRGWSQGQLARELGVSRQTVNAIEMGRFDPSLPLALRIADLFGQPVEQIFTLHPANNRGSARR